MICYYCELNLIFLRPLLEISFPGHRIFTLNYKIYQNPGYFLTTNGPFIILSWNFEFLNSLPLHCLSLFREPMSLAMSILPNSRYDLKVNQLSAHLRSLAVKNHDILFLKISRSCTRRKIASKTLLLDRVINFCKS